MRIVHKVLLGALLAALTGTGASGGQKLDVAVKAKLQAAMQQHIERNLIDGAYLQLDTTSGQVRVLHPYKAHPVILTMGEHFILCSDFRDDKGKTVNVDFYMARRGQSYVVFHNTVDNHELLARLMKAGQVKRAD